VFRGDFDDDDDYDDYFICVSPSFPAIDLLHKKKKKSFARTPSLTPPFALFCFFSLFICRLPKKRLVPAAASRNVLAPSSSSSMLSWRHQQAQFYHSSRKQEDEAAAASKAVDKKEGGDESGKSFWDPVYAIPLGITVAVPALHYEWVLVNEETQVTYLYARVLEIVPFVAALAEALSFRFARTGAIGGRSR